MNHFDRYYQILDLEPGASWEEINQAYRDLAFIWHPDRIPKDNPRLLEKAAAKLKAINQAREQLRSHSHSEQKSVSQSSWKQTTASHHDFSHNHKRPYYRDLIGADLRGANLKEKDLSGRNLSQANLSEADLSDSFLHQIILEGANLFRAKMFRANLLEANLRHANLQEAHLIGADFSGADLSGANLKGAKIGWGDRIMVKFTAVKLKGTILPDGSIHA